MLAYTGGASFGYCLGCAPDWLPFPSSTRAYLSVPERGSPTFENTPPTPALGEVNVNFIFEGSEVH